MVNNMGKRHQIKKLKLLVNANKSQDDRPLQLAINTFCETHLVPLMEQIFDEHFPHEFEVMHIGHLEFDLETIPRLNWQTQLKKVLAEKLSLALEKIKIDKPLSNYYTEKLPRSQFEQWLQFLKTGRLDTFSKTINKEERLDCILNTIASDSIQNQRFVQLMNADSKALKRLCLQHEDDFLVKLLGASTGKRHSEIPRIIELYKQIFQLPSIKQIFLHQYSPSTWQNELKQEKFWQLYIAFNLLSKHTTEEQHQDEMHFFDFLIRHWLPEQQKHTPVYQMLGEDYEKGKLGFLSTFPAFFSHIMQKKQAIKFGEVTNKSFDHTQGNSDWFKTNNLPLLTKPLGNEQTSKTQPSIKRTFKENSGGHPRASQNVVPPSQSSSSFHPWFQSKKSDQGQSNEKLEEISLNGTFSINNNIGKNSKTDKVFSSEKEFSQKLVAGLKNKELIKGKTVYNNSWEEYHQDWATEKFSKELYLSEVGIILLHPFFRTFFENLKLLEGRDFVNQDARIRAAHLIQYLATGDMTHEEYEMDWAKILCGIELNLPIQRNAGLTNAELEESDLLVQAMIDNWTAVGEASPSFIRENFFRRQGKLVKLGESWTLSVEENTMDILLQRLPWGLGVVKLPWLPFIIYVDWS